ncbi:MAG: GNAT family N-acetyltransferase [Planctomycetes bacterium]|nr:GNAT family N-acetyltransferase [Planctomycetota bacterium]
MVRASSRGCCCTSRKTPKTPHASWATRWPRSKLPPLLARHHVGEVLELYVEPDARGKGVGPALLEVAEGALAHRGAEVFRVRVPCVSEHALGRFEAAGYRPLQTTFERRSSGTDRTMEGLPIRNARRGDIPASSSWPTRCSRRRRVAIRDSRPTRAHASTSRGALRRLDRRPRPRHRRGGGGRASGGRVRHGSRGAGLHVASARAA